MEKLQRRLRLFIILALVTGAAAALFVGTAHAQTTTAPTVTIADLGLQSAPPQGGLAAWWDGLTDSLRLQFTFNDERKAELQLRRAAKVLVKLESAADGTQVQALLEKYRSAVAAIAAKGQASDSFLQQLLAHQGFLTQLQGRSSADLAPDFDVTRNQNWAKLDARVTDAAGLAQRLAALAGDEPEAVARRAALLEEWRQRLSPEQQEQARAAVDSLVQKLRALSPAQAAAIAEHLRAFSASQAAQASVGAMLEKIQPALRGLAQQLAKPRQPNQDPTPSVVPTGSLSNVSVPALTPEELAELRADLASAKTREQLLALRQRWYGNQLLYRQLAQYQRNLLDQLNAKLVKASGSQATPLPAASPEENVTPLPTQQLTPEQQAMGQAFIQMQGINTSDLPPPAVSY